MADIIAIAHKTIDCMNKKCADKGQVFVTESQTQEFNMENGKFTLFRTLFNEDINVLTYLNQKKGSYYSNKLEDSSIENAVDMALMSAQSGSEDEAYDIAPYQGDIYADKGVYNPDMELLFDRSYELAEHIKSEYKNVLLNSLIVSHNKRHMAYVNTNGTFCEEYIGSYSIGIEISGHEGDKTTSAIYAGFDTDKLDKPFIEMANIREKLQIASKQLDVQPMEGKFTGTMILSPSCAGYFMYFVTSLASGSAILEKTSIWLNMLEKQVADSRISICIDPEDKRIVCGETLTFDGFKSEPYDFIKNGQLKNFIIDYYISKKTGYNRSKNGQLNFIIQPGTQSLDEIIKNVKNGILVDSFSGGQPGINGDFSGVAKNSFLIENGKIKGALSETMVNGNIAEMLNHLSGISTETVCTGGDVLPYMAFDGIIISGK